jgi:hypothetical protein
MSCVLRISVTDPLTYGLQPYRIENGTAHIRVSDAGFDDVKTQISDAVAFLQSNQEQLRNAMGQLDARGVLDFAVEWRDVAIQSDAFSADLVREAGLLGLALEFTHYPQAEVPGADA